MTHTATRSATRWAVVIAAAAALAACSDSGSDYSAPPPPPPAPPPATTGDVPNTALATPAAWTAYIAGQPKSETGKPLDVTGVVPPVSESAGPAPI
jgi:hypothetical protein